MAYCTLLGNPAAVVDNMDFFHYKEGVFSLRFGCLQPGPTLRLSSSTKQLEQGGAASCT